jgi:hypothetical protein
MKKLFYFVILSILFFPLNAKAEQWTWSDIIYTSTAGSYGFFGGLFFDFFSCPLSIGCNYSKRPALVNPTITSNYHANIFNSSKNVYLSDGDIVEVGDSLDISTDLDEVSWTGTGFAIDTPLGHLTPNAAPSSSLCSPEEQTTVRYDVCVWRTFVSLSVNPPIPEITQTGTANLSCQGGSSNTVCKVNSPGEIVINFNIPNTYGKFYFQSSRYNWSDPGFCSGYGVNGCFPNDDPSVSGTNDPLTLCSGETFSNFDSSQPGYSFFAARATSCSPFQASIPAQSRTLRLIAVGVDSSNNPPLLTVSHPASAYVGEEVLIVLNATDPENDRVQYAVDWDGDEIAESWLPSASGYVFSGTSQQINKTWVIEGKKNFWVMSRDEKGARSEWQNRNIDISTKVGNDPNYCPAEGGTRSCSTGLLGVCSSGQQTCTGNTWGTCIQLFSSNNNEICGNGLDDNCDGQTDENCSVNNPPPVTPICNKNKQCERSKGENFFNCSDCRGILKEF